MTIPAKFFGRSQGEQRLFIEALFWLAVCRAAILVVPFRRIAPFLGQTMVETPAHTWMRCGDRILTGGADHRQFTVVAVLEGGHRAYLID